MFICIFVEEYLPIVCPLREYIEIFVHNRTLAILMTLTLKQ